MLVSAVRLLLTVGLLVTSVSAFAQVPDPPLEGASDPTPVLDGPPAPVPPLTISRDEEGDATVRAIKLLAPLVVDGRLDEDVYTSNPPFGDLIQVVPATGKPATERTDLWLMFDDNNIIV